MTREGGLPKDHLNPAYDQDENGVIDEDKVKVDVSGLQNQILDQAVDIAELNYAQGLNADSRDNIFVDPFVDMSKIASSSNINLTTGTNGNVILKIDSYNPSSDITVSSSSGSSISETNDIAFDVDISNNGIIDEIGFEGSADGRTMNIEIKDTDGNVLASKSRDTIQNSWTTVTFSNTDYSRFLRGGETVTVSITGDYAYTGTLNVSNSDVSIDGSQVPLVGNSSGGVLIGYSTLSYLSNGTVTSTTIDKGYIPSSLQIDADVVTDADTTVEIDAYDGNGNKTTWSESELGTEKSVGFQDSLFQIDVNLSSSDSAKTPTVNDYGLDVNR